MSKDYKKLFGSKAVILTNSDRETLGSEIESVQYMEEYFKKKKRFIPPTDFSQPKNFARFGSAEKYYIDAIERIYKTYPYDGSLKERVQWELSSSYFDLYVFENEYPRTNGFISIASEGWGTQVSNFNHYGATATASYEYIFLEGGPHTSYRAKGQDIQDTTGDYKDGYANIYDFAKDRESNLKIDGIDGNTVEFWMKKSEFVTSKTGREVIFDAHTSDFISSSVNYGRLTLEMTGASSGSPFLLTYMSGTSGVATASIGESITISSIADNKWHHYAFVMENSASNLKIDFYIDGKCNSAVTAGSSINYVSGNINATIGSLITAPSGTTQPTKGWGKLSGSLDEFRFWKKARTSQQIGRYYIEPVGGGTNTDDANTDLGVYYKFNEGITLTSSTDEIILDYSGRISNGTFTGYVSSARNTGSAIVQSGKATSEFKDPILYDFHPDVVSYKDKKEQEGKNYDYSNNASIYHTLPGWITDEDGDKKDPTLKNLTQIIGSYFDSLSSQINAVPKLKHRNYLSSSFKPYPFANKLLQSVGFEYFPELFSDADLLEQFRNRDNTLLFKQKLYDIKNQIYQNIYNNIVYIYKTKGTEQSFRNLIRCFGVDDEIYKINLYANNMDYELKDNYKSTAESKKYVNFALTGAYEATVFPHSASSNSNSTSFLSASRRTDNTRENAGLAFTMESEVSFPVKYSLGDSNTVLNNISASSVPIRTTLPLLTSSLFGAHQVVGTTENKLTWASTDYANFQVLAVKNDYEYSAFSKRAKFVLTGTANSVIPTLTSSFFDELYDDTRWTFSVSVRPSNYPQSNKPSGSDDPTYTVEFYGVEKVLDSVKNEFLLTGTITNTNGRRFLANPKSVYVGAHRLNFSGTVQQRSDVKVSSTRVWMSYLSASTVRQHAQDVKNYGVPSPYRSAYLYQDSMDGYRIPEIDTLALNWTFDTVTGSDSSGEFIGTDFSSGSTSLARYNWLGDVIGKQYLPRGYGFVASFSGTIDNKYVYSAKKQLPEIINSSDMTNVLSEDDIMFNKGDFLRPINYHTFIEKSMYQTISEEMIRMFSSIKDFNNLIGNPVNKYRLNYKHMEKLRQLFFERVGNTPNLDKYIDYYKWLDATLDSMLEYLIPASSDISSPTDSNIATVVESHVLERNKYNWKYPTLEDRTSDPEGTILGVNELLYDWGFGHAPVDGTQQDDNCLWWKQRAERDESDLASSDTSLNSDKQEILDVLNNQTNANNYTLYDNVTSTSYSGSTYAIRKLAKPYKLDVDQSKTYKGGANFYQNKKIGFFDAINQFNSGSEYAHQRADRSFLEGYVGGKLVAGCNDDRILNNGKKKYSFKVKSKVGGGVFTADDEYKGQKAFPFSFYSASIKGGVNKYINDNFIENVDITNMHIDSTNLNGEVPAQGPFTSKFVGGRTYRHIFSNFAPNKTPDNQNNRLEGYVLDLTTNAFKLYNADFERVNGLRAQYFRNVLAKRPVNIENIQQFTGAASSTTVKPGRPGQALNTTNIGNYTKDYEIVMSNGRSINNKYFIENEKITASSNNMNAVDQVKTYTLPDRGKNDYIIVNKFSAPGAPSSMGAGYLDLEANEYSVYNSMPWRNIIVRSALDELYVDHTKPFGYFSDTQYSSSWVRAIRAGWKAGNSYPGTTGSVSVSTYQGTASYHKTNRNPRLLPQYSNAFTGDAGTIKSGTVYDNWFVQHPIPRSEYQYQWITSSADASKNPFLGYQQPNFSNASLASTDITFISQSQIEDASAIKVDFAGLNNLIVDPIISGTNTLSASQYLAYGNYDLGDGLDPSHILNGLNLHRNGPYQWASWQQIRGGDNPIMRLYKTTNRFSFEGASNILVKEDGNKTPVNKILSHGSAVSQIEPPITSKYSPLKHDLSIKVGVGQQRQTLLNSYGNELCKFTAKQSADDGFKDLNNCSTIRFYDPNKKVLIYDSLNDFILGNQSTTATNPVDKLYSITVNETIFPRAKYTYLKKVRQRDNFQNNFWRDNRTDRNKILINSQGQSPKDSSGNILTASMWHLDARTDFSESPGSSFKSSQLLFGSGSEGELQNAYSLFHSGVSGFPLPAVLYNRRVPEVFTCKGGARSCSGQKLLYSGDTKWEAASQMGENPFYKDYDTYVNELRSAGKDYGIIPEFRISEHIDFYLNTKGGDFLAENTASFSITGSSVSSSAQSDFYKIYAHSDFMQHFEVIQNDYKGVAQATEFKLKCKGLLKFLPYDGFYPSQRTVQLATMFSQSYGPTVTGSTFSGDFNFRTMIQPLFAPGILYNSIKSGIAVDYPIVTGSIGGAYNMKITGSNANGTRDLGDPRLSGTFDYRLPFEALASPNYYLNGLSVADAEPHPSASLANSTGTFGVGINDTFKLAMNNFLAETPAFFLQDSKLTSLESLSDSNKFNVEAGKKYVMRIVCSHSRYRKLSDIESNDLIGLTKWSQPSYIWNPPTISMYNRSFNLSTKKDYQMRIIGDAVTTSVTNNLFNGTFVYGSSFGPPCDAKSTRGSDIYKQSAFDPFTPPYYAGYSHIELSYIPQIDGQVDFSDIMPHIKASASFYRQPVQAQYAGCTVTNISQGNTTDHVNTMNLSASVLWDQIKVVPAGANLDDGGNIISRDATSFGSRWVIQPKWETPILDFNNADITLPNLGSGSVAKGMWHQYGQIPEKNAGVFLAVQDLDQSEIIDSTKTGSLAALVGFNRNSEVKLGKTAERKTIREGIVCVPFFQDTDSVRKYFLIPRETVDRASLILDGQKESVDKKPNRIFDPATSTVEMVEKMRKYVIPPRFDFLTSEEVEPMAMFIFDFEVQLDQQDLANIWQNLPPTSIDSARGVIKTSEVTIPSNLFADIGDPLNPNPTYKGWDLMIQFAKDVSGRDFPSNIQWLVFKVKQKAEKNYYKLTAAGSDDNLFTISAKVGDKTVRRIPKYSYNWPYDYFSLVELAKIDAEVKIAPATPYEPVDATYDDIVDDAAPKQISPTKTDAAAPKIGLDVSPTSITSLTPEQTRLLQSVPTITPEMLQTVPTTTPLVTPEMLQTTPIVTSMATSFVDADGNVVRSKNNSSRNNRGDR